jgi:pilus assembly protein CpaF
MRMAMNRLILGETRDAEAAEAFIDVCASGHSGMTTVHARSAKDALARFELFLGRVQGNVGIDTIRRQISNAVDIVVHLVVDREDGKRRVAEVVEVLGASEGVIQMAPMFRRIPQSYPAQWVRDSGLSRFSDLCERYGIELPPRGVPFGAAGETDDIFD